MKARTPPSPPWLSLAVLEAWVPTADRSGVSVRARAPGQFVAQFRAAGGHRSRLDPWWRARRDAFVARHLAELRRRKEPLFDVRGWPTRRHLALVMWAYSPDPRALAAATRRLAALGAR